MALDELGRDLLLACRRLRKSPTFTAVAVATLALVIGANTAIFSIADAVLFRPLPYADPDRVYVLTSVDTKTGQRSRAVPFTYLQAIDEHHRGLSEVGLRGPTTMMTHAGPIDAEWMETVAVRPSYLRVLGVQPARGRLFDDRDTAEPGRSAVITYESWRGRFGGDEQIVGRRVRLGAETREVVGVLPPDFVFPATTLNFLYSRTGRPEFLTVAPLHFSDGDRDDGVPPIVNRGVADEAVVRLEPGVTLERAQAEIASLVAPLAAGRTDTVMLETPHAVLFPAGRPMMAFLVAAAAFVLLIGCANLAHMLLARTRAREREIGLCTALGATRLRIVRPILFETLLVGIAAGVLALLMTTITFDMLLRQVPPIAYGSAAVRLDLRVAVYAVALGILAGLGFADDRKH